MTEPSVWIDSGDGWQELPGVTHVGIGYDPPDWIEGYGTGEMRGLLAAWAERREPTPVERALQILAPHLAREPLYRPGVAPWLV
ncbi:hypothetical protein [Streptomyces hirsutus]|uniref:hypothetical protein n=1 Tax=Streptomyces hirsutus TaxID=35620 RepID=UPI00369E5FAC